MRILVLQHHDAEHPGIFRDFLAEDGIDWEVALLHQGDPLPDPVDYDAVWAMGGPMDVWEQTRFPWLAPEKRFIHAAVYEHRLPFLGCCLGHQLLAEAAGGECRPLAAPEIGMLEVELTEDGTRDPLLAGLASPLRVLQWHGTEVTRIPPNATVLAHSAASPVQAFRIAGHAAWGLQFHAEVTADMIDEWGEIAEYAAALRRAHGSEALPALRADLVRELPVLQREARSIYDRFMEAVADTS